MGEPSFSDLKHRYLDAVCFALGLVEADRRIAGNWGIVRARGKLASVYFEHDRGLCHFSVGPASAAEPTCSVDEIAHRFPRIRALPFGTSACRLKSSAISSRVTGPIYRGMFGPDGLEETRRWLADRAAAITAKYAKRD